MIEMPFTSPIGGLPRRTGDYRASVLRSAAERLIERDLSGATALVHHIAPLHPRDPTVAWALAHLAWMAGDLSTTRRVLRDLADHVPAEADNAAFAADALGLAQMSGHVSRVQPVHSTPLAILARAFCPSRAHETWPRAEHAPVALVLGTALAADGRPGDELLARLRRVLEIVGSETIVVLSGGNGSAGTTEARAMARWLVERGIDPGRLVEETTSTTTIENALASASTLVERGLSRVVVVTSATHMPRALVLLEYAAEICRAARRGIPPITFSGYSAPDRDSVAEDEESRTAHRARSARDVVRMSGLWTIPGVFR